MKNNVLPDLLSLFLRGSLALLGLLIACLLLLGVFHPLGLVPENLHPSIELPVRLSGIEQHYEVAELDENLKFEGFENGKISMEIKPQSYSALYFGVYLYAALYLGIFWGLTFLLHRLIVSFKTSTPFQSVNVQRIRQMGVLLVLIPLIKIISQAFLSNGLQNKFAIAGGEIITMPGWEQMDTLAIVMAAVLWILAEVFRRGAELQEFEAQTV